MEEKKKTGVFNICTYVLGIIAIVFTIYTIYIIKEFSLFKFLNISNYIYIAGIIIILLLTICIFKFKKTAIVLSILTIILNSGFFYGIQSITGLFEKFSQNAKYEEIRVNIYTLKENERKDISSIIKDLEQDKELVIIGSKNDEDIAKKTKDKLVEDIVNKNNNKLSKEKVNEKLKIEYRSFHSIRHSYATRLFELDIPIKTVQSLMGHSDMSTTMDIYTHVMKDKKLEILDKLDNL